MSPQLISRRANRVVSMLFTFAFASVMIGGTFPPAFAQADHTTDHVIEPFDIVVPASDTCTGEDVHIYGILVDTIQTTIDKKGGQHISMQFVPYLVGEGESTGALYLPKGPAHVASVTAPSGTTVFEVTNVIRLIAPGDAGNLMVTEHVHFTANPDGTVTVDRDYVTAACRG
jgi:hypothetical protein